MSEKKGPFDAALKELYITIDAVRTNKMASAAYHKAYPNEQGDDFSYYNQCISECETAIRVLEAARRVPKKKAIECLLGLFLGTMTSSECQNTFGLINKFLEVLPEWGKEE